jgi:hypothetical protein
MLEVSGYCQPSFLIRPFNIDKEPLSETSRLTYDIYRAHLDNYRRGILLVVAGLFPPLLDRKDKRGVGEVNGKNSTVKCRSSTTTRTEAPELSMLW